MVLLRGYVVAAFVAAAAAKSAVLDLIPKNFDDVVLKSGKPTLVEFFAPWCGHCKKLAPVYEELATAFEGFSDKVQIAKVDADAEKSLGKRFGVQGFPTLKWFDGTSEEPTDYKGGRDFDSLADFITQKTSVRPKKKWTPPSLVQMMHDHTFNDFVGKDKDVFVAFTAPWCGHCKSLAPIWEELAGIYEPENVVIAKVDADNENSKQLAQKEGISSFPTIKWFKAGSTEGELYEGGRKIENFVKFVNREGNLHRAVGGSLDELAGTIETLDAVVAKYATAGKDKLAELTAEAKKEADKLTDAAQTKYAQYYTRVFDKLSQNEGYVEKEIARLEGMIKKGGLALPKRDEITTKLNVLKKFVQTATEDVKEDAADAKDEL